MRTTAPRAWLTLRAPGDGRDRASRFRIASGECAEASAALRIAVAWRYVADEAIAAALGFADRLCAILWRLRHPRR